MTLDQQETYAFGTNAVHLGAPIDATTGAVIEAVSLLTTFAQLAPAKPLGEFEYLRSDNPNRQNFERAVAALEQAKYAIAVSSGSAATALVIQLLPVGAHIISGGDVYGGTHRYFTKVANTHGVDATFVNDLERDLKGAVKDNTALVWLETPSNPTLAVTSIALVAAQIKELNQGRANPILLAVDNTFSSPYITNPLAHGADIVSHSVTKYLNGHSDVVMGVVAVNSAELHDKIRFLQNAVGAIPSPFDLWLAHRGLKTLHLRVRQASATAQKLAEFLAAHPAVKAVNYPGLPDHPNHAVVLKQHRGGLGGGMISFRINGNAAAALKFCQLTKLFTLAESLGGIESLCEVPAVMTHGGIPQQQRELVGVFDDLIRLSVGIEDTDDLIRDVEQALAAAT